MVTRLKAPATPIPQTLEEAEKLAAALGENMRLLDRHNSRLADSIAALQVKSKEISGPAVKEIEAQFKALTAFAQARRSEILPKGLKSVVIAAGTIGWRLGNKKLVVAPDMEEAVIDFLQENAPHFVREKLELDKEALIAAKALPDGLENVTISQSEAFFFKPLAVDLEKSKTTGTVTPEQEAA